MHPGDRNPEVRPAPLAAPERHFYAANRAFGRLGMRIFDPHVMAAPHWHGHIEANFASGFEMTYDVDGRRLTVPPDRLVLFWAGVPHRVTAVTPQGPGPHRLANIYLPLDSFLMMHHIAATQVALLGGGVIALPAPLCGADQLQRWYADYRSGDAERIEILKMDLNALLRRAALGGTDLLRPPEHAGAGDRRLSSAHIHHVIAMVRHVLDHLDQPLRNADIAAVTGLHQTYALALFSRAMQTPLRQFVIRMRLMRARGLLLESSLAIATVVDRSGFSSVSQFYHQFKAAYGMSPQALRARHLRSEAGMRPGAGGA